MSAKYKKIQDGGYINVTNTKWQPNLKIHKMATKIWKQRMIEKGPNDLKIVLTQKFKKSSYMGFDDLR